jgi:formylmethanofuran dehydrogenase subunit E
MEEILIAGKPVEAFLEEIRKFHGWVAPGVLLGGFMVDYALELVGKEVEADAIVETRFCLPDAVQLLTPCTFGNGWMKVLDWDKFALSLYDKKTREGFRVRLDVDKTTAFPDLYNWFMKLVEKKDLPLEVLNQTILEAGREALSADPVFITNYYAKIKKGKTGICPSCGEAYTLRQGALCISCQGEGYYQPNENPADPFLRRAVSY